MELVPEQAQAMRELPGEVTVQPRFASDLAVRVLNVHDKHPPPTRPATAHRAIAVIRGRGLVRTDLEF